MSTCGRCGHEFFFVKVDGDWYPYELTEEPRVLVVINDTLERRTPLQLHQCRREWVREFEAKLARECSKCSQPAGEFCQAMSGSCPRPKLKTLFHTER